MKSINEDSPLADLNSSLVRDLIKQKELRYAARYILNHYPVGSTTYRDLVKHIQQAEDDHDFVMLFLSRKGYRELALTIDKMAQFFHWNETAIIATIQKLLREDYLDEIRKRNSP